MNTGTSSHKMRTLIKLDLKKYWVLSLATFIALLVSNIFPIILAYGNKEAFVGMVEYFFNGGNVGFISFIIAIISAICVFRYLHNIGAVTEIHSMPVSRDRLFAAHTISGYIIAVAPFIAQTIILFVIKREALIDGINIFTTANILENMLLTMLIVLYVFAISVLASMLTGTVAMNIVGAFGLNILAPATASYIAMYSGYFLKGYASPFDTYGIFAPSFSLIELGGVSHQALKVVIYLAVAFACLAVSLILYRVRKLEKATDHIAFNFMIPIVCGLLTFFTASMAAWIFFSDTMIGIVISLAVGSIVSYILYRMLVLKTTHVWDKETLKALIIYLVVFGVFFSIFCFDLTGYEKREAKVEKTKYVSSAVYENNLGDRFNGQYFIGNASRIESEGNITLMKDFHKEIKDSDDGDDSSWLEGFAIKSSDNSGYVSDNTFAFVYENGKRFERQYDVDYEMFRDSEALAKIYSSDEFKEKFAISNMRIVKNQKLKAKLQASFQGKITDAYEDVNYETDDKKLDELIEAMDKDFADRTFEEETTDSYDDILGTIDLYSSYYYDRSDIAPEDEGFLDASVSITVYKTDKNTIKWLKKNGYYDIYDEQDLHISSTSLTYVNDSEFMNGTTQALSKIETVEEFLSKYGDGARYSRYGENMTNGYYIDIMIGNNEEKVLSLFYPADGTYPEFFDGVNWEQ